MMKNVSINIIKISFLANNLARLLSSVTASTGEAVRKAEHHTASRRSVRPPHSLGEHSVVGAFKVLSVCAFDLAVLTLGIYPTEIRTYFFKDIFSSRFFTTLLEIAKNWKQC